MGPPMMSGLFGTAAGIAATTAAALLADSVLGTTHLAAALAVLTAVAAAVSFATTAAGALATAAHAWCLYSGFLVGRAGTLVFDAQTGRALVLLCAVTGIASLLGSARELDRSVRRIAPLRERPVQPPPVARHGQHPQVHVVRVGQ